jgi:O-antigen ligase/polysaccharide polymerase Wzy-like membrane protein
VDRLTKIVVLAWICAAIALQIWVQTPGWPNLPLIGALVAAVSLAAGFVEPRAVAVVLAISYLFPVIVRTLHGGTAYAPNEIVWITAFAGVLMPGAARTAWNIPARWRGMLVAAALVVVVTSPIVCLREIDLNPGLLRDLRGWSFGGATWPSLVVTWSLYSSLTLVLGLVWFDWLFSARDFDFERFVLVPFAASATLLLVVLIYQLFVDIGFLNDTVYGVIGRAGGTMYDANLSGTVAALWVGGLVLLAWRAPRYRGLLATVGGLAAWLGVWASGSRTAFAAAAIVTLTIAIAAVAEHRFSGVTRLSIPAAVGGAILLFAALVAVANPRVVGPVGRVWATLPSPSEESVRTFAAEMWNRNRYGLAATAIVKDHPWFGIGVGTYQTIAYDYVSDGPLQPDNAQNWLRHQVVEFGVIGSLGWIIWFVTFALAVLRVRRNESAGTWITRGMLVAFGVISMFGMPGQAVVVAITFWTIAFWYLSFKTSGALDTAVPRWTWAAVITVAVMAGAGTAWDAVTALRVPERARASTWPYSYGFAAPQAAEGSEGYRQTRSHALTVLDVPSRWLSVSVRPDASAAGREPVDVRVWADGATVLKAQLQNSGPLTAIVQLPTGSKRVLLEAAGRRIDSSRPFFVRDAEALYFLKWEFLDRPPADFNGAGYHRTISS